MTPTPPQSPPDAERLLAEAAWLRGLAQALVGDRGPDAVDDLVQDTLLARLRRRGPPPDHERPWLRRVATNLVRESFRRRSARARRERAAAQPEAQASAGDVVARAQAHRLLVDALLDLEEPYRTVLLRRFFDSTEPSEIARQLGVPAATVRTRIHRGVARLRDNLTARHGGRRDEWLAGLAVLATPAAAPAAKLAFGSVGAFLMHKYALAALALLVAGGLSWFVAGTHANSRDPASGSDRVATPAIAQGPSTLAVDALPAPDPGPDPDPDPDPQRQPAPAPAEKSQDAAASGAEIVVRVIGEGRARARTAVVFERADYPASVGGRFARRDADRTARFVDARARIAGLATGERWVAVLEGERILAQRSVELIAERAVTEVVFPLGMATIEGVVRDDQGRPAGAQLVRCSLLEKGAYRCDVRTDERGRYRFEAVPLGTAWLGVYADADFSRAPRFMREFSIDESRSYRIDFGTERAATIWRGAVRNALGNLVPGQAADFRAGQLFLREDATGERRMVPLRPDGTFEATLSPGSWTVEVRAPSQPGRGTQLAAPVEIGSDDFYRELEMPWRRVEGRLFDRETEAPITGEILADTRIELWRVPTEETTEPETAARARLIGVHRVDSETGSFLFDAVEPGKGYELRCPAIGAERAFTLAGDRDLLQVDLFGRRPR